MALFVFSSGCSATVPEQPDNYPESFRRAFIVFNIATWKARYTGEASWTDPTNSRNKLTALYMKGFQGCLWQDLNIYLSQASHCIDHRLCAESVTGVSLLDSCLWDSSQSLFPAVDHTATPTTFSDPMWLFLWMGRFRPWEGTNLNYHPRFHHFTFGVLSHYFVALFQRPQLLLGIGAWLEEVRS